MKMLKAEIRVVLKHRGNECSCTEAQILRYVEMLGTLTFTYYRGILGVKELKLTKSMAWIPRAAPLNQYSLHRGTLKGTSTDYGKPKWLGEKGRKVLFLTLTTVKKRK